MIIYLQKITNPALIQPFIKEGSLLKRNILAIKFTNFISKISTWPVILKLIILGAVLVSLYSFISIKFSFFSPYQAKLNDNYIQIIAIFKQPPKLLDKLVLVSIDSESIRIINRHWPWERRIFAYIIKKLQDYSPRLIFFDFVFCGKSSRYDDRLLKKALAIKDNIFIAAYINDKGKYIEPDEMFRNDQKRYGLINKPRDKDFFVRRARALVFSKDNYIIDYSFAIKMFSAFKALPMVDLFYDNTTNALYLPGRDQTYTINLYKDKTFDIDYSFLPKRLQIIPLWKLLKDEVLAQDLYDKIILVGTTAEVIHDIYNTPLGILAGVVINAYEFLTLLNNQFYRYLPGGFSFLLILLIVSLTIMISYWLDLRKSLAFFILIIGFVNFMAIGFYFYKIKIDAFGMMLLSLLVYIGVNFYKQIKLIMESSKLRELALTDSLTGVYVRRYFQLRIQYEWERAVRYQQNFAVIMLDIDKFKNINDSYGHLAGDYVLKELSNILKANCRKVDIICRYGGEEFCIIIPQVSKEQAFFHAEKLRREIAKYNFLYQDRILKVTVSIGIAAFKEAINTTPEELIRLADERLYLAKKRGRNCIIINNQE